MNSFFKRRSLLMTFLLAMIGCLTLPFFVLLVISSRNIQRIEEDTARQYMAANLNTISSSIEGVLRNLDNLYVPLLIDTEFTGTIRKLAPYDQREAWQDFLDTNRIRDTLLETAATNTNVYAVYTGCMQAGRFFSSRVNWDHSFHVSSPEESDWYRSWLAHPSDGWVLTRSREDGRPILSSYRSIKHDGVLYGLLSITVDTDFLSSQLTLALPEETSIGFLSGTDGTLICASSSLPDTLSQYEAIWDETSGDSIGTLHPVTIAHEKKYAFSFRSEATGFVYTILTPAKAVNSISSMAASMIRMQAVIVLILLLLIICLAVYLFFRPIRTLFDGMNRVSRGDFTVRLPASKIYEIGYINEQFNDMTGSIETLIRDNYAHQLQRQEAELFNLQNQLNEHFLYNTLDTIRWKARMENAGQSAQMVYDLARFYRINLSSGQHFVPIGNIVSMARSYLDLQTIRLGEALQVSLFADPALSDRLVLKYLFQPIIENSFAHGRDGLQRPLRLDVSFSIEADRFVFRVRDNGVGMTDEQRQALQRSLQSDAESTEHFALRLIHRQLEEEYHLKDPLTIESEAGEWCLVSFSIPLSLLKVGSL